MNGPSDQSESNLSQGAERTRLNLVSEPLSAANTSQTTDQMTTGTGRDAHPTGRPSRAFVGVQFDCCSIYARIYCNAAGTAYVGNCPRCARKIEIKIVPGGSTSRFFTAN